ncbi:MAG: amino acid ABC transporter substrate-binding protein, partial [Comamonas sp.]
MRLMTANITLACTALLAAFGAQAQTAPGGTLDKVQKSGKVVIGVRESSAPMAYAIGANHRFAGYHVELCE